MAYGGLDKSMDAARKSGGIPQVSTSSAWVRRMSRLTRDETAEPVSRDQILRRVRGHRNIYSPCLADHEQDWQHPVDPYSALCDDHSHINVGTNDQYLFMPRA